MAVELFNSTNRMIRIPQYNYKGSYVFEPYEAKLIEEDRAAFFKPYARAGIIVRTPLALSKRTIEDIKVAGVEIADSAVQLKDTVAKSVKDIADGTVETVGKVADHAQKVASDVIEDTVNDVTEVTDKVKKYTEEFLDSLKLVELKEKAQEFGIDASNINKKSEVKEMILAAQKKRQ